MEPEKEHETKVRLIRCGIEFFTEFGFNGVGINQVLARAEVPKGSFYHHFRDKEDYVLQVILHYDQYFQKKLRKHFDAEEVSPLRRLRNFRDDAVKGMVRYKYRRGCLVGNLGQEMGAQSNALRCAMKDIWTAWERLVAELLEEAKRVGEIPETSDCVSLSVLFWLGWEGAILRAKLLESETPMIWFVDEFIQRMTHSSKNHPFPKL